MFQYYIALRYIVKWCCVLVLWPWITDVIALLEFACEMIDDRTNDDDDDDVPALSARANHATGHIAAAREAAAAGPNEQSCAVCSISALLVCIFQCITHALAPLLYELVLWRRSSGARIFAYKRNSRLNVHCQKIPFMFYRYRGTPRA